jgi:lipopolysaccharide transport system permease protein
MMKNFLSEKNKYWLEFLLAMTNKEIKVRYKHAYLGFMWVFLNPLLQMLIIGFVFQFFIPVESNNYFLFLFTGLLPWNFFSMSVIKATPSIIFERSLIQKSSFPRETIPLSIVFSNLFHFLISLALLIVFLVINKIIFEDSSILQLIIYVFGFLKVIPLIIWLIILTSGLSLFFSSINTKYRDINFMIQAIMPLWFYATPIVYTLNLLPPSLNFIFYLNPTTSIIQGFQNIFIGTTDYSTALLISNLLITALIFFLGLKTFFKDSKYFDDWV